MNLLRPLMALMTLGLSACATLPPDQPADPLEPVNRAVFTFNRTADRYLLKPVAKGYDAAVPTVAKHGVSNFFSNLGEPITILNGLLQAKFVQASSDLGRFLLNSTAGFAGLMDVATDAGLPRHDEDFGQTLGHYGVGTGWYLMLPLIGPSDMRDVVGYSADYLTNPLYYVQGNNGDLDAVFYALTGLKVLDLRYQLLAADPLLDGALDPYIFVRTAYLQNRLNKVYDGRPPKELLYGSDD